ncbi:MAG: Alsin [Pycnora praestabilis]|nr:MAG: Alsin [Pycnora praestabilis]
MDVAMSSAANIEPPPLLFGPRPPTPTPHINHRSRNPQQPQASPPPRSRPAERPDDLESNSSIAMPTSNAQNHERPNTPIDDSHNLSNGHVPEPVDTTPEIREEHFDEAVDTMPDHTQQETPQSPNATAAASIDDSLAMGHGIPYDAISLSPEQAAEHNRSLGRILRAARNEVVADAGDGMDVTDDSADNAESEAPVMSINTREEEANLSRSGASTESTMQSSQTLPPAEFGDLARVTSNGTTVGPDDGDTMDIGGDLNHDPVADRPEEPLVHALVRGTETVPALPPPPADAHSPHADSSANSPDIDSDVDTSDEDTNRAPREQFPEDNSEPSAEELKEIEEGEPEISAFDHDHFETSFFQKLDDPEHVPGEMERINWTVTNVHGTWEEPNKQIIMRSPPVHIGGLDWNIKYYPKGNDTEQLSVYIECSKPQPEDHKQKHRIAETRASDNATQTEERPSIPETDIIAENLPSNTPEVGTSPVHHSENSEDNMIDSSPPPEGSGPIFDRSWSVAAQFGVVLYNPNEPRVHYSHGNHHRFCADSPDWGWTRFHGPHSKIHTRFRGQRQALLRNDTLAFTAYVRLIKDDTGALWSSTNEWDSYAKTGLRGLGQQGDRGAESYLIAGLSAWLLLAPIREIIYSVHVPNPLKEPRAPPKPLFAALQRVLYMLQTQIEPLPSPVSIAPILFAFEWYRFSLGPNLDVIEFWQVLRRMMEYETRGTDVEERFIAFFDGDLGRPSSGAMMIDEQHPVTIPGHLRLPIHDPDYRSVQEAVSSAFEKENGQAWWQTLRLPTLLTLELNRQIFDTSDRQWKKLVNKVELDEQIHLGSSETSPYTLYGFIVHEGDLQSGSYKSIVRPGGPNTKWFTYHDSSRQNKVLCLTRKQAIEIHEGVSGDHKREGMEDVAYIVLYVRKDLLGEVLKGFPREESEPKWLRDEVRREYFASLPTEYFHDVSPESLRGAEMVEKKHLEDAEVEGRDEPVDLRIFTSEIFKGHTGQGNIDVFANCWNSPCSNVYEVTMDPHSPLSAVQEKLATLIEEVQIPAQCRFWILEPSSESTAELRVIDERIKDLQTLRYDYPECSLWLHIISLANVPVIPLAKEPLQTPLNNSDLRDTPNVVQVSNRNSAALVEDSSAGSSRYSALRTTTEGVEDGQAAHTEHDSDITEHMEIEEITRRHQQVEANRNQRQQSEVSTDDEVVLPASENRHTDASPLLSNERSMQDLGAPAGTATSVSSVEDGDTEMAGADESSDAMVANPELSFTHRSEGGMVTYLDEGGPPVVEELPGFYRSPVTERIPTNIPPEPSPEKEDVYFFLKQFTPDTQSLVGIGCFLAKKSDKVDETVQTILGKDSLTLWQERRIDLGSKICPRRTFEQCDCLLGSIIIAQEARSNDETLRIEERGDYINTADYLPYLINRTYFSDQMDGYFTTNHFSGQLFSGQKKKGRAHGHGEYTYANGDTYIGNFTAHERRGYGKMIYQNKDEYEGTFVNNQMEGEGKFVYHKTGNTYVGNFKAGRRHGKGTMHFVVADEEQALCQICYEGEQEALFYDCGHVCACMECARQLESCPVCRKNVIAVVKIFRS